MLRALADRSPTTEVDVASERRRLQRILERRQDLYSLRDISRNRDLRDRTEIEAQVNSLGLTEPAELAGLRRAAEVLRNLEA